MSESRSGFRFAGRCTPRTTTWKAFTQVCIDALRTEDATLRRLFYVLVEREIGVIDFVRNHGQGVFRILSQRGEHARDISKLGARDAVFSYLLGVDKRGNQLGVFLHVGGATFVEAQRARADFGKLARLAWLKAEEEGKLAVDGVKSGHDGRDVFGRQGRRYAIMICHFI